MSSQETDQATLDDDLREAFDELEEGTEETSEAVEAAEVVEEAPQLDPIEPHPMMPKELRDVWDEWAQLENGRTYQENTLNTWKQIQGEITRSQQEAAQYRRNLEQWNGIFEPFQNELQMRGTNPVGLTTQLVGYYQNLLQDPATGIQRLASDFGVDLNQLVADQPYVPDEVRQMQNQLAQMQQAQAQREAQAQAAEEQAIMDRFVSFANETDESGNPLRPHLSTVQNDMAAMIYAFRAQTGRRPESDELQTLYDRACKLNEDVQAQVQQEQATKEAARKSSEAKKAKSAAKRPSGKPSGHEPSGKSLMDDLAEAWDEQAA